MVLANYPVRDANNNLKYFDAEDVNGVLRPGRHDRETHERLGAQDVAPAAADSGFYSINSLIKRILVRITQLLPSTLDDGLFRTSSANAFLEFNNGAGVVVNSTGVSLITIDCSRYKRVSFQVQNGTTALAGLTVNVRYSSGLAGLYNARVISTADYTTNSSQQTGNATNVVTASSGNLPTLPANTSGWVELNVERFESIRINAITASGTSTVTINGIAKA